MNDWLYLFWFLLFSCFCCNRDAITLNDDGLIVGQMQPVVDLFTLFFMFNLAQLLTEMIITCFWKKPIQLFFLCFVFFHFSFRPESIFPSVYLQNIFLSTSYFRSSRCADIMTRKTQQTIFGKSVLNFAYVQICTIFRHIISVIILWLWPRKIIQTYSIRWLNVRNWQWEIDK